MKTRILNAATILGIGAMLVGVATAKPASADERGHVDIKLARDIHIDLGFFARPPVREVVVVEDHWHDRNWYRDHDGHWHDRRCR